MRSAKRPWTNDWLRLAVLWGFAGAQPALDLLGRREAFVIDAGLNPAGLATLVGVILLGPGLLMGGLLWLSEQISWRLREAVVLALVCLFAAMIAMPLYRHYSLLFGLGVVLATVATGVASAVGYQRFAQLRRGVEVAAWGLPLFAWLFWTQSQAARMIAGGPRWSVTEIKPIPVVLVVFDEFSGLSLRRPDGTINARRFPNFARLARETTWYRNATTVNAETSCVVPALLTGRYPDPADVRGPTRHDASLFNLVMAGGRHELVAFEPVSRLAFDGDATAEWQKPPVWTQLATVLPEVAKSVLLHVLPREIRHILPQHRQAWWGVPDGGAVDRTRRRGVIRWGWSCQRREQFQHFLDCLASGEHPALHFLHLVFPHVPWMYLETGTPYSEECGDFSLLNFETAGLMQDVWGTDAEFVRRQQQRYLVQVELADRWVGELLDRLRAEGLYDDCLLIVTADHGVSFRPGENRRYVSKNNVDEILSTPLFVKLPGQRSGGVSDRNVETVDILPTVLDVLNIAPPLGLQGESLAGRESGKRTGKRFATTFAIRELPADLLEGTTWPAEVEATFGDDPAGVYRPGRWSRWLGEPIGKLVDGSRQVAGVLELQRGETEPRREAGHWLPAYFEAVWRPVDATAAVPELAVALNGVLWSAGPASETPSVRGHWEALLPEAAFQPGVNRAEFFVIEPRGDGTPRLIPVVTRQGKPRVLSSPQ
jgi:hypothetical protein